MNTLTINGKLINSRGDLAWLLTTGVLCLIGLVGLANYLIQGHDAYNIYRQVPWGILISTYIFFVVSSTGLCLVSSLGHVFGIKQFEVIGKRAIAMAIITLLSGFAVIAAEIGYPFRMLIYNILTPNLAAAIWWMGTLYGLYLVFILLEFRFMIKVNHKWAGYLGLAGFIAGVAAHSNLGAVFGYLDARPWWHGPFLPIYFILSAAVTGCAIILLLYAVRYAREEMPVRISETLVSISRLFAMLLGILLFFEAWKVLTSVYGGAPGKYEAMMILLSGPLSWSFWGFEILLGMLLPFILLLATGGRNLKVATWAALSSMIGIFFMRYNLVVTGQLVPLRSDVDAVGASGLLSYTPSLTEIAIVLGGMGLCLLLYILAGRFFNLDADNH
ncbi:NrfD/PsrC family molybdoenzyme membrane anchor subunit [Desulfurivibrio dismutans]|uniref:NrfD/PsrC family molybdoenzyme membrane anchor subunit n=1 Tax=Desulfurivibrio dismutans TaxID=1398908 RepID=UPI0023DA25F3|nr:NrfD/PsrC family molybdoenzyme membrane anchor subunit [Desulfurivibrio alkaliphilus]MDF1614593.1 polysulfide reductase NrfD [Desulfurivibrio alkaliphilus]